MIRFRMTFLQCNDVKKQGIIDMWLWQVPWVTGTCDPSSVRVSLVFCDMRLQWPVGPGLTFQRLQPLWPGRPWHSWVAIICDCDPRKCGKASLVSAAASSQPWQLPSHQPATTWPSLSPGLNAWIVTVHYKSNALDKSLLPYTAQKSKSDIYSRISYSIDSIPFLYHLRYLL